MYVIMQKDIETRQTMVIAGIEATDKEEAQAEFTEWIRARIIEDGSGYYKADPQPGLYDDQDRALLLDGEAVTSFLLSGDLFFIYETEEETEEEQKSIVSNEQKHSI
jgi:hypothetical protein